MIFLKATSEQENEKKVWRIGFLILETSKTCLLEINMSLGGGFKYIHIYIFFCILFSFYPYLGKIPILTCAYFSNGWVKNHQLGHQRNPRFKLWGCQHKSGGQRMRRGHQLMLQKSGEKKNSPVEGQVVYRHFLQGFIDPKGGWPRDFWKISTIQALRHTHEGPAIFSKESRNSPNMQDIYRSFPRPFKIGIRSCLMRDHAKCWSAQDHAKREGGAQKTIPKTRSYIDDYNYHTMQNDRGPTSHKFWSHLYTPVVSGIAFCNSKHLETLHANHA